MLDANELADIGAGLCRKPQFGNKGISQMTQELEPIQPRRQRWPLTVALAVALSASAGGIYYTRPRADPAPANSANNPAPAGNSTAEAPVHVAIVERQNFPLFLTGLGTVQPTNSVNVRTRVDGQIEKIAFEEGQPVREGDLLVKIDAAPFEAALHQAEAKLAQDTASLTNAKQDLERTKALSRNGNATLQLLDQRVAAVSQLTAQLLADNATIEAAQVQLGYTTIVAPLSGRVGFRAVDKGNIVHATDPAGILTINQIEPISVVFTAPEQDLPAISESAKSGPLKTLAFSSDGKKQLGEGELKLIDNQIDQASGTIRLKATFANANAAFWPGFSGSTKLRVGTLNKVLVVPDSAVQRGPNGLFVFVATPDLKAEQRPVNVGHIGENLAVIESGLVEGERVVISGHYRVQAGSSLQILPELGPVPAKITSQAKAD